jgi:hypothetical protein
VRAKLVSDPKDYRWSGYGEACGGGKRAREGLVAVHDSRWLEQPGGWRQAAKRYRVLLYTAGEERREACGRVARPGIAAEEVERVIEAGGKLTLQQALRCRVRYFTDGMAVGGKAFVDGVFEANRPFFGPKRRDGARKMRFAEWGGLRVARALRVDAVSFPLTT